MAKNDRAFAEEFAAIIHFRLQSSEDKIYALTFYRLVREPFYYFIDVFAVYVYNLL